MLRVLAFAALFIAGLFFLFAATYAHAAHSPPGWYITVPLAAFSFLLFFQSWRVSGPTIWEPIARVAVQVIWALGSLSLISFTAELYMNMRWGPGEFDDPNWLVYRGALGLGSVGMLIWLRRLTRQPKQKWEV